MTTAEERLRDFAEGRVEPKLWTRKERRRTGDMKVLGYIGKGIRFGRGGMATFTVSIPYQFRGVMGELSNVIGEPCIITIQSVTGDEYKQIVLGDLEGEEDESR